MKMVMVKTDLPKENVNLSMTGTMTEEVVVIVVEVVTAEVVGEIAEAVEEIGEVEEIAAQGDK